MNPGEIISQLETKPALVALLAIGFFVVLILLFSHKPLRRGIAEWRIQRCLGKIGCDQIRNLRCPDGLDGFYSLDRIALVQDAILLIVYKPYGGNIYCADRIAEWTQIIGQKSFKFENPLFDLEHQLTALRSLSGGMPVQGFLFFSHSATFPKGHPEVILERDNIPDRFLRANCEPVNPQVRAAWDLLKAQRKQHLASHRASVKT